MAPVTAVEPYETDCPAVVMATVPDPSNELGKGKTFRNTEEAWRAWDAGVIGLQSLINVTINGERIETTMGRIVFNNNIWEVKDKYNVEREAFINETVGKNCR